MSMNFVNEPTRAWNPKNRLREMINEGSDADRQGKSPYDFSKTVTDEIIKIKEKIDRQ